MRPTTYPSINNITMVVPIKITEFGIYVQLLEYNNIEGLIILSDLSKSRIKSINKIVKIGKKFAASVQTVDIVGKNITLSKKIVSETEAKTCENDYKSLKFVQDLVTFFVRKLEKEHNIVVSSETIYQTFIWCLSHDVEFLLFSLKSASKTFDRVYETKLDQVDPLWITCFREVLALKFKNKDVLLEAVLEITCYETDGISIIKTALVEASKMATTEFPFKVKIVKSPYYSITIKTANQEAAMTVINDVINITKISLEKNGVNFKIYKMPEIVVDKEFEPEDSGTEDSEYDG